MDIAKTFERAPDSTAVKSGNLDIPELRPTHTGSALQFFVCFCLPNDEVALFQPYFIYKGGKLYQPT